MKQNIPVLLAILFLTSCNSKTEEKKPQLIPKDEKVSDILKPKETEVVQLKKDIADFIPAGYVLYKEEGMADIKGDLNGDSLEDVVFLIKGTDKTKFFDHEYRGKLDRNRRGIIILFNRGDGYELATKNYNCFSSENEEGGVYYAPELWLAVEKGNLKINYAHGRYGSWSYTFRHKNGDFEMIGYDSDYNRGPVPQTITSINLLTKKKLTRDNLNKDDDGENYVENFKDTWETIKVDRLLKLSEIKDFDELEF